MRELKIGDRVVDWKDRAGVVLTVASGVDSNPDFTMRYDEDGSERGWSWYEFSILDLPDPDGTLRFEDTEYPEWPR